MSVLVIIAALTQTSAFMFKATNNRAYFHEINIIVPDTWTPKPEHQVRTDVTYEDPSIVVELPTISSLPYVNHNGDCGGQGDYIHLTPTYLIHDIYEMVYGNRGRFLTTQWAKYRWGVFEESPTAEGVPQFYFSNQTGNVEVTKCSGAITGETWYYNTTVYPYHWRDCEVDENTGVYEDGCMFIIDANQTATSSLMYIRDFEGIDYFCDNLSDVNSLHNHEAPTLHNSRCGRRSVWEVLRQSEDFAGGKNAPTSLKRAPQFTVIRNNSDDTVVLVLDTSTSTIPGNASRHGRDVATEYILSWAPNATKIGIVTFSDTATEAAPLTVVMGKDTRQLLVDSIPVKSYGGSSIGGALQLATQLIASQSAVKDGGRVIVISNGEENEAPFISDIASYVTIHGVIVDMVTLPGGYEVRLQQLVKQSGGTIHPYEKFTKRTSKAMQASSKTMDSYKNSGVIFTLDGGGIHDNVSLIETMVAVFEFRWQKCCFPMFVRLITPSGITITPQSTTYYINTMTCMVVIDTSNIDDLIKAYWNMEIHGAVPSNLTQRIEMYTHYKDKQDAHSAPNSPENRSEHVTSDVTAPARIIDLKATVADYPTIDAVRRHGNVSLSWTATGDDLYNGTASRYVLKISTNYSRLFEDFPSARNINESDLVEDSAEVTAPEPSGSRQSIVIRLKNLDESPAVYFAIAADDDAGNHGERSNIASVDINEFTASTVNTPTVNSSTIFHQSTFTGPFRSSSTSRPPVLSSTLSVTSPIQQQTGYNASSSWQPDITPTAYVPGAVDDVATPSTASTVIFSTIVVVVLVLCVSVLSVASYQKLNCRTRKIQPLQNKSATETEHSVVITLGDVDYI
ncbi:LOW QUALITY PROTEIN: calcium-activated chloride channel regulator 4-like [Saccoglossus kowalevskii]